MLKDEPCITYSISKVRDPAPQPSAAAAARQAQGTSTACATANASYIETGNKPTRIIRKEEHTDTRTFYITARAPKLQGERRAVAAARQATWSRGVCTGSSHVR